MSIDALLKTNVNGHVEKKNGLSYLSWAWAWAEALKADPKATFKVEMFGDKCYMEINGTAMVWVTVTMFDKPMTCQLPVMDFRNNSISVDKLTSFDVNKTIQRATAKAIAMHGLGLTLWSGEDVPELQAKPKTAPKSFTLDIGDENWEKVMKYIGANKSKGLPTILKQLETKYKITAKVKKELQKAVK